MRVTLAVEAVRLPAIFSPVLEVERSTSRAASEDALSVTTAGVPVPAEESDMTGEPDVLADRLAAADVTFMVPVDVPVNVNDVEALSFTHELPLVLFIATFGAFVTMLALLAPIAPLPDDNVNVPPVDMFVDAA